MCIVTQRVRAEVMRDDLNDDCTEDCAILARLRKMKFRRGQKAARYTIVKREGERRPGEKGDGTIFRRSSLELRPVKPTVLRVT